MVIANLTSTFSSNNPLSKFLKFKKLHNSDVCYFMGLTLTRTLKSVLIIFLRSSNIFFLRLIRNMCAHCLWLKCSIRIILELCYCFYDLVTHRFTGLLILKRYCVTFVKKCVEYVNSQLCMYQIVLYILMDKTSVRCKLVCVTIYFFLTVFCD